MRKNVAELADRLKDEHDEAAPDLDASVYSDLLGYALQCVDWDEIATYLFDEAGKGEA